MPRFHAYLDELEQDALTLDLKHSHSIDRYYIGETAIFERRGLSGWGYFPRKAIEGRPFVKGMFPRFS